MGDSNISETVIHPLENFPDREMNQVNNPSTNHPQDNPGAYECKFLTNTKASQDRLKWAIFNFQLYKKLGLDSPQAIYTIY